MRLLYVDVKWPRPERDAASQRAVQVIAALVRLGYDVEIGVIDAIEMDGVEPPADLAGARPIRDPGVDAVLARAASAAPPFDVAVLAWTRTAQHLIDPLRVASPGTAIVFDTVDVNHVREFRHARVTGNANLLRRAVAMKAAESRAVAAADVTLAVTEADADVLRGLGPAGRIEVVTLGVARRVSPVPGPAGRAGMLFLGSLHAWHNVDAIVHLAEDLLPVVRSRRPAMTLTVAGAGWAEQVDSITDPAVVRIGAVADLEPVFDAARMFACPLRFGSGIKGKLLTALALGLPIVTGSIGAEGMHLTDEHDCLLADTPEAFVDAVARLDADDELWLRLSAAGRDHVEATFGLDTVERQVRAVFGPLVENRATPAAVSVANGGRV